MAGATPSKRWPWAGLALDEVEALGEQAASRAASALERCEATPQGASAPGHRAAIEQAASQAQSELGDLGRELLRRRSRTIQEAVTEVLAVERLPGLELVAWPWRAPNVGRAHCLSPLHDRVAQRAVEDLCLLLPVWAWASVVRTADHRGLLGARLLVTADGIKVLEQLPVLREALVVDVPAWLVSHRQLAAQASGATTEGWSWLGRAGTAALTGREDLELASALWTAAVVLAFVEPDDRLHAFELEWRRRRAALRGREAERPAPVGELSDEESQFLHRLLFVISETSYHLAPVLGTPSEGEELTREWAQVVRAVSDRLDPEGDLVRQAFEQSFRMLRETQPGSGDEPA